ncbi:MAG: hypothetical protein IT305_08400 [Chloroflexi bacterium]|nr:hypothetical protein [Chloroflexota bacterium]
MSRTRFALTVAGTSLAVAIGLGIVAILAAPAALASAVFGDPFGGPFGGGFADHIPPELQGLKDLPPAERFAHFTGAQISLKDKDNKPFVISIVPGTLTSVSPNSVALAANDGSSKTFALTSTTLIRKRPEGNTPPQQGQTVLTPGDRVVVIVRDGEPAARAVVSGGKTGFGGPGGRGPWAGPWGQGR